MISRSFPTSSILWFCFLFLTPISDNFIGHFAANSIIIFSSFAAFFTPWSAMPLIRFVVHNLFLTARGMWAVRKQVICLKTFSKIGAEGPNFLNVTAHSWSSTATAAPVQVAFRERCQVYLAPSDSRGRRRWIQRFIHGCSPWTVNHSKAEMLLCFARRTVKQAALLQWAQLNHKQASWCSNEGVLATGKNSLYPPVFQTTGLVSVQSMIIFFPQCFYCRSQIWPSCNAQQQKHSLLIVSLLSILRDWCF